ncbi:serine/threonine-protein kinase [Streptosporangium sp. KLBMP 9127]|nr:protein kinase [Streptosporangium sp. KLBMP 9127]
MDNVVARGFGGRNGISPPGVSAIMTTEHPGAERLRPTDPESIGPYSLLGRLGEGGMGTVYLATGTAGRPVAVKVVKPQYAVVEGFTARFHAEVDNARRVASFCTAQVLDNGNNDDGLPYMVTEYIPGTPLSRQISEHGALEPGPLHGVALGVAAALAAIHVAGLVHRDLKPANVILSMSGPRVIDFGISRALDQTHGFTMSGELIGSPGWWAPEQVRGLAISPAVDVFAWGCLVAYAGNGRHPYGRGDAITLASRVINGPPDLGTLPAPLDRLVRQATAMDPAQRPSAQDLLLSLVGGVPATPLAKEPENPPTLIATDLLVESWQPPANVGDDATLTLSALGVPPANTPNTPDPANTPNTPDMANTPNTPDVANTPNTPDMANTQNTQNTPDIADTANTAGIADPADTAASAAVASTADTESTRHHRPASTRPQGQASAPDTISAQHQGPASAPGTIDTRQQGTEPGIGSATRVTSVAAEEGPGIVEPVAVPVRAKTAGRRWLIAAGAAVAALAVTAGVLAVTASDDPQTPSRGKVAAGEQMTDVGRRITSGSYVEDPQLIISRPPECGLADFAGVVAVTGRFCVIRWTLLNPGGMDVLLSPDPLTLIDDQGTAHTSHASSTSQPNSIAPGDRIDGVLLFDLPSGRKPAKLTGHVLDSGANVEVRLS